MSVARPTSTYSELFHDTLFVLSAPAVVRVWRFTGLQAKSRANFFRVYRISTRNLEVRGIEPLSGEAVRTRLQA